MEEATKMRLKIPKWMIEFTGHTMLHNRPPWFVYRPDIHKVRGPDVRRILETVRIGDILLRRFDGYLNTIFTPGFWGHAGLYVGDNQVVHSVSRGVVQEDILNFCRTDAVCVLSVVNALYEITTQAINKAKFAAEKRTPYDFDFAAKNKKYYCTEMVDIIYGGIFCDDYIGKFGRLILTPDGIRYSKRVLVRLEIKP